MTEKNDKELMEFRVQTLESAFAKLSDSLGVIKEAVLRFETRFNDGSNFPLQCGLHRERLEAFDKRLSAVEEAMESIKSYMNKAIGAILILTAVIQLVGPMVLDHFKEHVKPVATQSDSSGGYWQAKTNYNFQ